MDSRYDRLRDECVIKTCEVLERERIERDAENADLARVAARPYRIIHELPRKHTINGYALDV